MSTFKGRISAASPIQSGTSKSGKEYQRQEFMLIYDNTNAEYPKAITFSVMNAKIQEFNLQVGHTYEVDVDFSSREYNGRYYMSANCWKASPLNALQPAPQQPSQPANVPTDPYAIMGAQQTNNATQPMQAIDLPF